MSHTTQCQALLTFVLLATLSGCGGGGNGYGSSDNPAPPAPAPTDFTMLVRELFATTADNTDPISVSELDLLFADEDNPAAFDEFLE